MNTPRHPSELAWPGLSVSDCVIDGEDGIPGSIQRSDTPRATAQRYFASEAGVGFSEVTCRVGYIKLWTRQDSWDYNGRDNYGDDRIPDDDVRLDLDTHRWVWRETGEDAEDFIESLYPDEPPHDWMPKDYDPVWEFVDKDHPRAIKVWVCALK